jgi:putative tricarboxylic transport membrane protein
VVRTVDRWLGVAIALLGAVVAVTARRFPDVPGQKLGASTMPLIVAAGLFACGLLLLWRSARGRPVARGLAGAAATDAPAMAGAGERIGPALAVLAAVGLYLLAAEALGYLLVAPLCLLLAMRGLQVPWGRAVGWSLLASVAVHLAFYKLLKVPLPWGIVPVLY